MRVGEFLVQATKRLQSAGIDTARLDCLIALEDVLAQDRAIILAHADAELSVPQLAALNNFVTQRARHVPLAYYRGKAAFYGRDFIVNNYVLAPRPESESIIELLKKCSFPARPHIADVGTGSGCLGITAALEIPNAQLFLYDIDTAALEVAKQNATKQRLASSIYFKRQDLLAGCQEWFDVILANLPYVPSRYPVNRAAAYEPKLALYSGTDGLDHYRKFWKQVGALNSSSSPSGRPTHIIVEGLPGQHAAIKTLAAAAGYIAEEVDGYAIHLRAQHLA